MGHYQRDLVLPRAGFGSPRLAARLAALGLLFALAACGSSGPAFGPPTPGVAATVEMTSDLAFSPAEVTIKVGETVEWRNTGSAVHTVTADRRLLTADAANIALPAGAKPFHSARVAGGALFRHTFKTPGTYRYICLPHEGQMFGTVVVEES